MKKIILFFLLQFSVIAFAQPGTVDTTFDPGTGTDERVSTSLIQPDGKIIIGGQFSTYNNIKKKYIARLNTDGSLDLGFNTGIGPDYDVYSSALQADGKIVIGGTFWNCDNIPRAHIARLKADGSLDTGFDPGTGIDAGPNSNIVCINIQPDGKVIIGGNFSKFNGIARNNVARLNPDGSLDTSFVSGTGASGANYDHVDAILVQPDGKIIIGGDFTSYNGTARKGIARLNSDGSLDTTFNPGTGTVGYIEAMLLQPDGKIIIGGEFSGYNGMVKNQLARLNMDGSLDNTFDSGSGCPSEIYTMCLQSDGKIIIGGAFGTYNGTNRSYLARVNTNGSLDASFDPGKEIKWDVLTTSIQSDGKIIVGGLFDEFVGSVKNHIVRINNELLPPIASAQSPCVNSTVSNLVASGTNLKWYASATGGTVLSPTTMVTAGTYYVSQTVGGVESAKAAVPVTINTPVTPIFTQVNNICPGATLQALPTTSANGITGTWSPALDNTKTTTYTFTPTAGQCATTASMTIALSQSITPTFTQVSAICTGATLQALPTASNNGVTGTWSPVLNNTATTIYTFTPTSGSCATTATMTITVNPIVNPTFIQVNAVCSGATLQALSTTSVNNVTGTWSPALDNSKTTNYTFTPTAGLCATSSTLTIAVNPIVAPAFTQVNAVCSGLTLQALTTTSNNNITGAWSPALDNTKTTDYTFTPTAGQCATTAKMTITVKPNATTIFTQINPICAGTVLELSATSDNGITGTWSPAPNNSNTTSYTFTPNAESCGTTANMTVAVNALPDVDVDYTKVICSGSNEDVQLNAGLLSGSQSDYSYEWSKDDVLLSSANGYNLTVKTDGVYTCVVKNNTTGCQKIRTNTVAYSVSVTIKDVIITDLTQHNTVTVVSSGPANSEYSLDNPTGPFQDSNVFENVEPGIHIVYLNDKKGCGMVSKTVAVAGAPPFFTPNGDGYNDKWNLQGIDETFYKNSTVDIFDRYGKLLKVLSDAVSDGWDGTYNNYPQPGDDYWFVINMQDGRVVKGHFALKR